MKKLLLVLAIGAFAASCNDGGSAETKPDSTAAPVVDSPAAPAPTVDTTTHAVDTTAKAVDTTKK